MTGPPNGGQLTTEPLVPVSWGELIDKITILEIKSERIRSEASLHNIRAELSQLEAVAASVLAQDERVRSARRNLKQLNETLWDVEDRIRAKERDQQFDQEFIGLARSVYKTNDSRSAIKREINAHTASPLVEEKQYTAYKSNG
jgi:hypothetical protein